MLQRARRVLFVLIALTLAGGTGAFASDTGYGTPAYSTRPLTLFEGPGLRYQVTGAIDKDMALTVYRCSVLWCAVGNAQGKGWTGLGGLDFGVPGPRWSYASGGPGQVCFYEGHNYTGPSLCLGSGRTFYDLLLHGLDDRYSSVSVEGDVSASVCRDRDFQSYCERVIVSQPSLDNFLDNNVSSIRVH